MRPATFTILLTLVYLITATPIVFASEQQATDSCPLAEEKLCMRHALVDMALIASTITAHVEAGRLEEGEQLAWFYGNFIPMIKEAGLPARLVAWRTENRDGLEAPAPDDATAVIFWLSDWIEASQIPSNIQQISNGLTQRIDSTNPSLSKKIKKQTLERYVFLSKSVNANNYQNYSGSIGNVARYYGRELPKEAGEALFAWIALANTINAPLNEEIFILSDLAASAAEIGDNELADTAFDMALEHYREAVGALDLNPTVWFWAWENLATNLIQADRLEIAGETFVQVEQAIKAFDNEDRSLTQRLADFRQYLTEAKFNR